MVLNRQKKTLVILALVVIALTSIFQLYTALNSAPKVIDKKSYFALGEIATKTGIDINNTAADFGRIPKFSSTQKRFQIANTYGEEVTVVVKTSGDIAKMIEIRPNYVTLQPEESTEIIAQFYSGNYSYGNYTGEIVILIMS